MDKEDIKFDWERILLGDAPAGFLLEVLLRTIIVYMVLLVIVRFLGKRMSGQLTITELAVMLTLGAIMSPPMQDPAKGILVGIMILICAVLFQRGSTWLFFKKARFEEIALGKVSTLVEDGVINIAELEKANISRQQLFAKLRESDVYNLGEIERVYLEACGIFSVYKSQQAGRGLPLYPPEDNDLADKNEDERELRVCVSCGQTTNVYMQRCTNCDGTEWIKI
jgi:uncharacterized membrane protein YcaP (DUF421 family)